MFDGMFDGLALLVALAAVGYLLIFGRAARHLMSQSPATEGVPIDSNDADPPMRIGTRVRIQHLASRPEYNGRAARIIEDLDSNSRYVIEVEPLPAERSDRWRRRPRLRVRPCNLAREGQAPMTAQPPRACDADIHETDTCHRCLEVMAPLTWRGDERYRAVCCGNQMCGSCWTAQLQKREALSRRVADLKQTPRDRVDAADARELLAELERSDQCDLCRAAAPHSPEAAAAAVRHHAEAGKAWAQYMLGNKYQSGSGVPKDHACAFEWFHKAATSPTPPPNAAQALGSAYLAGAGVHADYAEALRWLRPAAVAGHATAMHNLGRMYADGLGVRQSPEEAAKWWLRGAEAGSHNCQSDLGCCYENGDGVPQSDVHARQWFLAAAEQGNATAQFNYGGILFRTGQATGQPELLREAVEWCRKSAASGYADAVQMLRQLQP